MSEPREERCERCRFCGSGITNGGWRFRDCRINPPTSGEDYGRVFPRVMENDWCGKFEPKPAPPT